jgi:hypothetical protein
MTPEQRKTLTAVLNRVKRRGELIRDVEIVALAETGLNELEGGNGSPKP